MPKIITNEKGVVIHLERIKEILSLKGDIKIPWQSIKRISAKKPRWLIFTPRLGTNLPGVIMAGTFYRRSGKSFYFVRNLNNCITFTLKDHQFDEIVIEVKDKEKEVERLCNLLKKYGVWRPKGIEDDAGEDIIYSITQGDGFNHTQFRIYVDQ